MTNWPLVPVKCPVCEGVAFYASPETPHLLYTLVSRSHIYYFDNSDPVKFFHPNSEDNIICCNCLATLNQSGIEALRQAFYEISTNNL